MAEAQAAAEPTFREQVDAAEAQEAPAPESAQETAPPEGEAASEVTAEVEPGHQEPQKLVPLGALHEERQKRKNAEQSARQQQEQFRQLQAQQVEMMRYLQSLAPQPPPVPSFDQDPLTNIGASVQRTNAEVQDLRRQMSQDAYDRQQAQANQQFVSTVNMSEAQFAKQAPDYFDAVTFARQKKAAEYESVGMTEREAWDRVDWEASQLAAMALQRGESPAEVGYRLAKAIGYQGKANGGDAQARLNMQQAGRAAATPSGSAGTGSRLSLDALAKMSGDEFLKATSGDNWRKLMGKQ